MSLKNSRKSKNNNDFFDRVFEIARTIPEGRVTTYGAIAKCIGSPGASRMVGWALNNCHTREEFVPAHRVVNRKGLLTGKHHFRHPDMMQELLESEGNPRFLGNIAGLKGAQDSFASELVFTYQYGRSPDESSDIMKSSPTVKPLFFDTDGNLRGVWTVPPGGGRLVVCSFISGAVSAYRGGGDDHQELIARAARFLTTRARD
jgi:methylated-DNA-protein-cysteine methyltransferase-like protein